MRLPVWSIIALQVIVGLFALWLGGLLAVCLTSLTARLPLQEFRKILEPWLTLGRLTNLGEVFYGEKTSEGFDI
jgi:hypothetical protein